MWITSWDIGIKNLSYCTMEYTGDGNEVNIREWGVISLCDSSTKCKKVPFEEYIHKIFQKLDLMFLCNDMCILIENQPCIKNPTMKSIQTVMYTYFHYKKHTVFPDLEVKLVSALNKLKVGKDVLYPKSILAVKSVYSQKKKKAVFLCDSLLDEKIENYSDWVSFFSSSKKKDDLADSFLYCLWYIRSH